MLREDVMKNRVLFQVDAQTGSPIKPTGSKQSLTSLVGEKTFRTIQSLEGDYEGMRGDKVAEQKMNQRQWLITTGIVVASLALFYLALKQGWIKIK